MQVLNNSRKKSLKSIKSAKSLRSKSFKSSKTNHSLLEFCNCPKALILNNNEMQTLAIAAIVKSYFP